MPNFDKTGPKGEGEVTGLGLGNCENSNVERRGTGRGPCGQGLGRGDTNRGSKRGPSRGPGRGQGRRNK